LKADHYSTVKTANNGSGWAFGGNVPMGSAGFQNQARQMGGNISFAQSLSGSQPATPLDLSEFPSLSNNSQLNNANQASMWSSGNGRNLSGPIQRNQATPVSAQQGGQDDLFAPGSSRLATHQSSFRFGNQGSMASASQGQPSTVDDFPPLNRTGNGEIGTDRSTNLMSLPFGAQQVASGAQRGNGLLNALSANTRTNDARSPPGIALNRGQDSKRLGADDDNRQKPAPREGGLTKATVEDASQNPLGAIGNEESIAKLRNAKETQAPDAVDPLNGMSAVDKWGIKGLRTLMNTYPDYQAMVVGMDPITIGIDINSQEMVSTQVYSLFDDVPPRPTVNGSKFRLPECYHVTNVQPIESKIQNFNEETLFWIFYGCPADLKQQLAAVELHSRNWRWHKKHQIWLTKDEHMTPQILSPNHERGFYIVWDTDNWRKDRRELTLFYGDLDTTLSQPPAIS